MSTLRVVGNKAWDWARQWFLFIQTCVALVSGGGVALWLQSAGPEAWPVLDANLLSGVFATLTQIWASLLGFVIAAITILLGYTSDNRLEVLRSSRQYPVFWDIFRSTSWILGLSTIVALLGLLVSSTRGVILWTIYVNVWFSVWALLRLTSCLWALNSIIRLVICADPLRRP